MSKVAALGYLVVRGPVDQWREFAPRVLGAQVVESDDSSAVRLRTDDRSWRIEIQDGPPGPDVLIAVGFEAANEEDLEAAVAHLDGQGVPVTEDDKRAQERGVRRLVAFRDPEGNQLELFVAAQSTREPFVSPRGVRFMCGDLGLGHVFMVSEDAAAAARFYRDALGFKLTDTIAFGAENAYFLHCNPRHHSMGFATIPGPPPGIQHLMLEVDSLEAVGRAQDIVKDLGYPLPIDFGEHSNDRMKSFYVGTPSGFAIEYGWNGRLVDDTHWKVAHYDDVSLWGHHVDASAFPSHDAPAEEEITS